MLKNSKIFLSVAVIFGYLKTDPLSIYQFTPQGLGCACKASWLRWIISVIPVPTLHLIMVFFILCCCFVFFIVILLRRWSFMTNFKCLTHGTDNMNRLSLNKTKWNSKQTCKQGKQTNRQVQQNNNKINKPADTQTDREKQTGKKDKKNIKKYTNIEINKPANKQKINKQTHRQRDKQLIITNNQMNKLSLTPLTSIVWVQAQAMVLSGVCGVPLHKVLSWWV